MESCGGAREGEGLEEEEEEEEVRLWSWGAGSDGQLGTGSPEDQHLPQPVTPLLPITGIACGGAHAIALTGGGMVLTWGRGTRGQLGHGELENCLKPKVVEFLGIFHMSFVSAGWNHSGFVTDNGRLFMCGDGSFGQLGNGDHQSHSFPFEVRFFVSRHVEQIACGMRHSLVLQRGSSRDSLYGFGSGRHGQIGPNISRSNKSNNLPKIIDGFDKCKIVYICANGDHSAALTANGQLYTWGRKFNGSLDDYYPQIWPSSLKFSQVALGWNHALVLADDEVYMLGGRRHGILGSSEEAILKQLTSMPPASCSTDDASTLERVECLDGEKVVHIAAGAEHSAVLTGKGTIMTWGWGEHGQLGLGNTDDQTRPQIVNVGSRADTSRYRVYCGSGFTFLVKSAYDNQFRSRISYIWSEKVTVPV